MRRIATIATMPVLLELSLSAIGASFLPEEGAPAVPGIDERGRPARAFGTFQR
jgi:hypothetical protein